MSMSKDFKELGEALHRRLLARNDNPLPLKSLNSSCLHWRRPSSAASLICLTLITQRPSR